MNKGFKIKRGVNLSHWLSQVFGWSPRESFITRDDLQAIALMGFDHVRLPIDEEELWDDEGNPIAEAWGYLTSCINWSLESGLRVIVDLHIVRSHHFNAANEGRKITLWTDRQAQLDFLDIWRQLSAVLKKFPTDWVAYEPMNEPVADNPQWWNDLIAESYALLRELEPNRVLLYGSNMWQNPENFPDLQLPEGCTNVLLSVHTYKPMLLTHHKAYWLPSRNYAGSTHYPGVPISESDMAEFKKIASSEALNYFLVNNKYYDRSVLVDELRPAIERARELGLPLYCGEFGCLPTMPAEMRKAYFNDMVSIFEEFDIAYTVWDYKGDFGIMGWNRETFTNGRLNSEILQILTNKDR